MYFLWRLYIKLYKYIYIICSILRRQGNLCKGAGGHKTQMQSL